MMATKISINNIATAENPIRINHFDISIYPQIHGIKLLHFTNELHNVFITQTHSRLLCLYV